MSEEQGQKQINSDMINLTVPASRLLKSEATQLLSNLLEQHQRGRLTPGQLDTFSAQVVDMIVCATLARIEERLLEIRLNQSNSPNP
jgi:hypothetical protein